MMNLKAKKLGMKIQVLKILQDLMQKNHKSTASGLLNLQNML